MSNIKENSKCCETVPRHLQITTPSPWVTRWAHLIASQGSVLDLAAGGGRHGRLFLNQNCNVTFLDQFTAPLADLADHANATVITANLEDQQPWPLDNHTFDAVIVVNYLYRPIFDKILSSLKPGGILLYETFAEGHEAFNRPRNPDHLLKPNELLDRTSTTLRTIAFEQGLVTLADIVGIKQRLCAVNDTQCGHCLEIT